ncbi:MAG: GtrA family protein [Bacteroidota bacterium]
MHIPNLKTILRKFAGFSIVGLVVTLLSMLITYILLKYLATPLFLTYILVYAVTIIVSFFLNSRLIFKTGVTWYNLLVYFLVYGAGLLIGTGLLAAFKILLPFENWILAFLVLPFTILSNFTLSYYFLKPAAQC